MIEKMNLPDLNKLHKHFMELHFNSVETIPGLNASAAFFSPLLERLKGQVDSSKVFKEDVDMVPTIIDESLS